MNQYFVPDRRTHMTLTVPAPGGLLMGINGLIKFLSAVKVVFRVRYDAALPCKWAASHEHTCALVVWLANPARIARSFEKCASRMLHQ